MTKKATGTIRVGIGGWTYEPWRGAFYPDGLAHKGELAFASQKLTTIEINGTFYRSQSPDTFAKWHDETPDDFVFALKAPRFATTRRVLSEAGKSIERFVTGGILKLGDKLGPINWQLMPTKQLDLDDFAGFLKLLPESVEGRQLRHAVEVRHDSFRSPDFVALARNHGVAIVLAGDSEHPQIADATAPIRLCAHHGHVGGSGGRLCRSGTRPLGRPGTQLGSRRGADGVRSAVRRDHPMPSLATSTSTSSTVTRSATLRRRWR